VRWLIDGYNVIRHDADMRDRDTARLAAGRAALLALLAAVARDVPDDFVVVFDGAHRGGGAPTGGRVEVLFSRPPDTADDVLRRLALAHREGAVVVTSDRAVLDATRRANAVGVRAEDFLRAVHQRLGRRDAEDELEPDEEEDAPRPTRGAAHRPSREARAAARVLQRLAGR